MVNSGPIYHIWQTIRSIEKRSTGHIIVLAVDTWDKDREALNKDYKAGRESPCDINVYMDDIINMLSPLPNIYYAKEEGYEADDLCMNAPDRFPNSIINMYSVDNDMLQIVDGVRVHQTYGLHEGKFQWYNNDYTMKKYGTPLPVPTMLRAIIGDSSDNLPSPVPRFPRDLARRLAKAFSTPNAFIEKANSVVTKLLNEEKVTHSKYAILLIENLEQLRINFEIMKFKKHDHFELRESDVLEARLVRKWRFNSLRKWIRSTHAWDYINIDGDLG